jgi:Ca-activated chloride channel family protein
MLEFANGWLLLLLPLVPLLFVWWLWRPRAALRFADIRPFAGLRSRRAWLARILGASVRSLALLSLIIALAGPRRPDLKTRLPTESIAIMIVMDVSGSMNQETFTWQEGSAPISRREAAQRAFKLFIRGGDAPDGTHFEGRSTERGTDAIGLVTFSNWPEPLSPPILNHSVLLRLLEGQRKGSVRDEGSNIGDAIAEGLIRLRKAAPERRALILISDGELNPPPEFNPKRKPLMPKQAAQYAANLGIPIYVIDTGGDPPANAKPDVISDRAEARRINQAVAEMTGGRSFAANNGRELLEVCRTIDRLERQPILSHAYRRYFEFYSWFVGVGLALIIAIAALELTRWRRIP